MIRDALRRFSHGPEGWPRLVLMTESGLKKKKKGANRTTRGLFRPRLETYTQFALYRPDKTTEVTDQP